MKLLTALLSMQLPAISKFIASSSKLLLPKNPVNMDNLRKFANSYTDTSSMHPSHLVVDVFDNTKGLLKYRIYKNSLNQTPTDIVIWIHGGGYIVGSVYNDDKITTLLQNKINTTVISLNYALAPENPFPEGLHNIVENIREISKLYPNSNLHIAGESAGANLCLASKYYNPDIHYKTISLVYPPIIPSSAPLRSKVKFKNLNGLLTNKSLKYIYQNYINTTSLPLKTLKPLFPMYYIDMFNNSKILLLVATHDILYDENIMFYNKAQSKNIPIELKVYPDIHGFFGRFGHGIDALDYLSNFILSHSKF